MEKKLIKELRPCKFYKIQVEASGIKRFIESGNDKYPVSSRTEYTECSNKKCKIYKFCKMSKFENLD